MNQSETAAEFRDPYRYKHTDLSEEWVKLMHEKSRARWMFWSGLTMCIVGGSASILLNYDLILNYIFWVQHGPANFLGGQFRLVD